MDAQSLLQAANKAYNERHFDEANAIAKQAVSLAPHDHKILVTAYNLATSAKDSEAQEQALGLLEAITRNNPEHDANRSLYGIYLQAKRPEAGLALSIQQLQYNPHNTAAHVARCRMAALMQRPDVLEEAVKDWREAEPDSPLARQIAQEGIAKKNLKGVNTLLEKYKQSQKETAVVTPTPPSAPLTLAERAFERKEYAQALPFIKQAVQQKPHEPRRWMLALSVTLQVEDRELQTRALAKLDEFAYARHPWLLPLLTKVHQTLDQTELAYKMINHRQAREPQNKAVLAEKLDFELHLDMPSAYDTAAALRDLDPTLAHPLMSLIALDMKAERFAEAQAHANELLAIDPKHQNGLRVAIVLEARKPSPNFATIEGHCRSLQKHHPTQLPVDIFVQALTEQHKDAEAYNVLKKHLAAQVAAETKPKFPRLLTLRSIAVRLGNPMLTDYQHFYQALCRTTLLSPSVKQRISPSSPSTHNLRDLTQKGARHDLQVLIGRYTGVSSVYARPYASEPVNMTAFTVLHNMDPRAKERGRLTRNLGSLEAEAGTETRRAKLIDALKDAMRINRGLER